MSDNPYRATKIASDESSEPRFGCYQFIAFGLVVFVVLMVFGLVWQSVAPVPILRPFPAVNGAAK